MEIEIFNSMPSLTGIEFQSDNGSVISESVQSGTTIETVERTGNSLETLLVSSYLVVTLVLLLRYVLNLFWMIRHTKNSYNTLEGLKLVSIPEENNVSSFFNYVFIHPKLLEDAAYAKNVLQHELIHSKQLHTLDVLVIELLSCMFWFNPFIWIYKRQIRENHEFLADELVVQSGIDLAAYSNSIIHSGNKLGVMPFISGFNFNHIKTRLIMLHQSKSSVRKRTFKSLIALILFAGIFSLSSFKDSKPQMVVVVDAGHGGKDSGNLIEKEIVLQISNKLARYSDQKIKIIETRNSDIFLSLAERVDLINQLKPDLVISLHSNASQNSEVNGVEAFYYHKNDHQEHSYQYSKILIENQLNQFSDRGEIKTAGFYLLKNSECPAVVLELGFITNEKDKAVLTNENNQEKIAKSLHESLLKIRDKMTN